MLNSRLSNEPQATREEKSALVEQNTVYSFAQSNHIIFPPNFRGLSLTSQTETPPFLWSLAEKLLNHAIRGERDGTT